VAGSFSLHAASLGMAFVCHLLLTRLLGARGYGVYAYALSWMMALIVPAMLGLDRLIVREVAVGNARDGEGSWRALLDWSGRMILASSTTLALLAATVSWLTTSSTEKPWAFWLAMGALPLAALLRLKQAVIQGMQRPVAGQIPEMIVQPLFFISLALATYFLMGKLSAAWAMSINVAATAAALTCGTILLARRFPAVIEESRRSAQAGLWLRSALPLLISSGINTINSQLPILTLGAMRGVEEAGILAVAKRMSDLTSLPLLALSAVLAPSVATLWATRDVRSLQWVMTQCARLVTLIAVPLAFAYIFFGSWLLKFFGAEFARGAPALAILSIGHIVNLTTGSASLLLVMTGYGREVAIVSVACFLLNFVFGVAIIPRWGGTGAAISAAAGMIIWNVWLVLRTRRLMGIRPTIFG
jgi:O-antigen/teichoic acid export membrane protein